MVNKKEVKKHKKTDENLEIKKEADKEEEKPRIQKKWIKQKQNKQIMWAIILMASLILIIVLVPFIVKNFVNKFVLFNLDFQKTKLGNIYFWSTRVPIVDNQGEIVNEYTMNFRNDPRELEKIEFTSFKNDVDYIYFKKNAVVYITFNPEMEACEDNLVALIPLAGFLRDFAKQNISSAVTDKNYAKINNMTYAACEDFKNNTIIYINSGNKTEIRKNDLNCYALTYNNCEITKVTEKFELVILEKYMSYFVKK